MCRISKSIIEHLLRQAEGACNSDILNITLLKKYWFIDYGTNGILEEENEHLLRDTLETCHLMESS